MAQYLKKFKGTIGKRQTQQILKLLNKKRNSGQIRTITEFSRQLENLMREITSTALKPTLKLFEAEANDFADSETHNYMLDRVQDDLEAAFEEALNIDEVQTSHEALVRDVILKNLRAGIAELESKVSLYEFINKDERGFDSAIFSTFRESQEGRTQRGGIRTRVLFTDPRWGAVVPAAQDADVELVGERLVLSNDDSAFYDITKVRQIFDSDSPQSELVVEPPDSKLSNIIDDTKGTYWVQALLFSEYRKSVKVKLELRLGSSREVNLVEVEPISKFGVILEEISYVDANHVVTNLGITERVLTSPASVRFKKVATDTIILTFRNENPARSQFEHGKGWPSLFQDALQEPPEGITPDVKRVSPELDEILGSAKVKKLIGVDDLPKRKVRRKKFRGYEFLVGIDNVRVGLTVHEPRSIYVSVPLSMSGSGGVCGLRTDETRPYIDENDGEIKFTDVTYDLDKESSLVEDDVFFQASIEHWLVKEDLNEQGTLLRTTVFPVLPLGAERVFHERLVLNEKSDPSLTENDIGTLMFYTSRTDGDIKVYRNGELLSDQTEVIGASDGWQYLDEEGRRTPDNGERMGFRIQVLGLVAGDIITVTYTALTSSTTATPNDLSSFDSVGGLKVVDMAGDLSVRTGPGQLMVLDQASAGTIANSIDIYLVTILRLNSANTSLTPAVEEYTLLAGNKDITKFEEV